MWEGVTPSSFEEVRIVGPNGEKVDVMTFRGFVRARYADSPQSDPDFKQAVEAEDDDAVETILNERFFHKPEMFYSPDKLVMSYGVPAPTPAFVYSAFNKKPLPTKDQLVGDLVDSIAARFNLRYNDAKWLATTLYLIADDATALQRFLDGRPDVIQRHAIQLAGRAGGTGPLCGARSRLRRRAAVAAGATISVRKRSRWIVISSV